MSSTASVLCLTGSSLHRPFCTVTIMVFVAGRRRCWAGSLLGLLVVGAACSWSCLLLGVFVVGAACWWPWISCPAVCCWPWVCCWSSDSAPGRASFWDRCSHAPLSGGPTCVQTSANSADEPRCWDEWRDRLTAKTKLYRRTKDPVVRHLRHRQLRALSRFTSRPRGQRVFLQRHAKCESRNGKFAAFGTCSSLSSFSAPITFWVRCTTVDPPCRTLLLTLEITTPKNTTVYADEQVYPHTCDKYILMSKPWQMSSGKKLKSTSLYNWIVTAHNSKTCHGK